MKNFNTVNKMKRARQKVKISFVKGQPVVYVYGLDRELNDRNFTEKDLTSIEYGNGTYANILVYKRKLTRKELELFELDYIGAYSQVIRKYIQEEY